MQTSATRFGGHDCSTDAAPLGGCALLIRQMQVESEYLEAASACCSLEGVCNPSEQGDGEQGVVSVFCNHLGRPGNLQ